MDGDLPQGAATLFMVLNSTAQVSSKQRLSSSFKYSWPLIKTLCECKKIPYIHRIIDLLRNQQCEYLLTTKWKKEDCK